MFAADTGRRLPLSVLALGSCEIIDMDHGPAVTARRLGFFSRLLDQADAGERYRLATEQIVWAERHGFDSAWVAQHHFVETEGGLPSPFVFLAQVAAHTARIRLGTGIVTLPMENPLRVAEDAAVLDLLAGGRLEVGVGSGGTPSAFASFGLDSAQRAEIFARHMEVVRDAWRGKALGGGANHLYPAAPLLVDRVWQATFSVAGGTRAGLAGDGLMLSRTQPRSASAPHALLADLQNPIIDAYLAALPHGREPRIMASRTLFVADDRKEALRLADIGLSRVVDHLVEIGSVAPGRSRPELMAALDMHVGTPDDVIASLRADSTLDRVTDLVFQVHSADPPHDHILRSIELTAKAVAPALGWEEGMAGKANGIVLAT
jgi:putative FMN-dependent luciferase-like monooxygenase